MFTFGRIVAGAAAVSRTTAKILKSGQTTSYRTGDDGDLEAGRATSFTVLAENNPFGNTNRFTDELGGQTYTNNWVIDWSTYDGSTVFGIYRVIQSTANWNTAIDNSLGTFGTFTGCRLPNIYELFNLSKHQAGASVLNYSPLNINVHIWSSTTLTTDSAEALRMLTNGTVISNTKTNSVQYVPCRTFTVTGTTLS